MRWQLAAKLLSGCDVGGNNSESDFLTFHQTKFPFDFLKVTCQVFACSVTSCPPKKDVLHNRGFYFFGKQRSWTLLCRVSENKLVSEWGAIAQELLMRNKIKLLLTFSSRSCYTHFSKSLSLEWNLVSFPPLPSHRTYCCFCQSTKEAGRKKKQLRCTILCVCVLGLFSLFALCLSVLTFCPRVVVLFL